MLEARSLAWLPPLGAALGLRGRGWGGRPTCPAPGGFGVPEKAAAARRALARGGGRPGEPRGSWPSPKSSRGPWQEQGAGGPDGVGADSMGTPGAGGSGPRVLSWGALARCLARLSGGCGGEGLRTLSAARACPPLPRPSTGSGCLEGSGSVGAGSLGQPPPNLGTALDGDSEPGPSPASEAAALGSLGPRVALPSSTGLGGRTGPASRQAAGLASGLRATGSRTLPPCFSAPRASFGDKLGSASSSLRTWPSRQAPCSGALAVSSPLESGSGRSGASVVGSGRSGVSVVGSGGPTSPCKAQGVRASAAGSEPLGWA